MATDIEVIAAVAGSITMTGGIKPTFKVDMAGLRRTFAPEQAALAGGGRFTRKITGTITLNSPSGTHDLPITIVLGADSLVRGEDADFDGRSPTKVNGQIIIVAGGNTMRNKALKLLMNGGRGGSAYATGNDENLIIALAGKGGDGHLAAPWVGSKDDGGSGGDGGSAYCFGGTGNDLYAEGGKGGDGGFGSSGEAGSTGIFVAEDGGDAGAGGPGGKGGLACIVGAESCFALEKGEQGGNGGPGGRGGFGRSGWFFGYPHAAPGKDASGGNAGDGGDQVGPTLGANSVISPQCSPGGPGSPGIPWFGGPAAASGAKH